jgi:hypothetical protein
MPTSQPPRGPRSPLAHVACLVLLTAVAASPAMAQSPLRTLPGLTDVAVYEVTSTVTRNAFAPNSTELATRRSVLNDSSRDFSHYAGENYDVYFSDSDGTPNLSGEFLTIEATWTGSQNDGSMNVTGAELFVNGQRLLANTVASYRLGGRCVPSACVASSVTRAVDGDLTFGTIPRMGATDPNNPADRMRLTLGFPRPTGSTLTLSPVAAVAPGGRLDFAWTNIGAASYTLGVVSGPGITAPLVLGTFGCCGTSFQVPPNIPLGTFRVAVAAGNVVSASIDVVIRFNFSPPVLAPVAPVALGGLLTFIWTPNPAVLYDLMVLSGPGVTAPFRVGQAACCIITLPVNRSIPPGTYTAAIVGAGIQSNVVSFQILGSASGFELSATSTIVRPGLQTTLSWTDRGMSAGPQYAVFAGPAGAASLGLVATQQCCVLAVPHSSVAPGSYDVYVQDSNGVRSNRVTIRFDP